MRNKHAQYCSISLKDCFGDLGVVGGMVVVKEEEYTTLEWFDLSCRALGRKTGDRLIKFLKQNYRIDHVEIYDTNKNDDIVALLQQNFDGGIL